MKRILAFLSTVLLAAAFQVQAANWHVSISNGKNKNPGTPGAPLKNIWKAIEKAKPGDMILIAEGNYPGKMSCGWINLDKPVSLIGGYSPDFSARDVLKYRTMLRPTNAQNTTKPTHGTLTINTRKFGPNSNILIDGIIFDHTAANSYHPVKGKPAGFKDGMLTIRPQKETLSILPSTSISSTLRPMDSLSFRTVSSSTDPAMRSSSPSIPETCGFSTTFSSATA